MKKHWHYYILLGIIFICGFLLTTFAGVSGQLQMVFIMMTAFLYVILGIYHHIREHSISAKVVIEYIIIAMLGISISFYIVSANL